MNEPISDETLDACIYIAQLMGSTYVEAGLIEAKQSRALVTQLKSENERLGRINSELVTRHNVMVRLDLDRAPLDEKIRDLEQLVTKLRALSERYIDDNGPATAVADELNALLTELDATEKLR
jgi:hypothetical protein